MFFFILAYLNFYKKLKYKKFYLIATNSSNTYLTEHLLYRKTSESILLFSTILPIRINFTFFLFISDRIIKEESSEQCLLMLTKCLLHSCGISK